MPFPSILKKLPGVQAAMHRWIKPHAHENGLQVTGCRLQGNPSSFVVLRSALVETFEELGIQSVLECTVSGGSVFGDDAPTNVSLWVTTPIRASFCRRARWARSAGPTVPGYNRSSLHPASVSFLNPMYIRLPRVDALVVLDYFDQIPEQDILCIIDRARAAGMRWLLSTDYPCLNSNWDTYVGEWRPISLTMKPFCLSEPVKWVPDPDPERRPDRSVGVFELRQKLKA